MTGDGFRIEKDSMGELKVPNKALWGAQTQRSFENFPIGERSMEKIPIELIHAYAELKQSCARVNNQLGNLEKNKMDVIVKTTKELLEGKLDKHFPLVIWQTGSGTQTNMNVNEVISNRATQILGGKIGSKMIHPNDDVNRSQSSNDTFPTAMHVATAISAHERLIPAITRMETEIAKIIQKYGSILKCGRTHTMDATPITVGQEFSGYQQQLVNSRLRIKRALKSVYELAIGGTAVGTGLNTLEGFGAGVAKDLAARLHIPFCAAPNYFEALSTNDALVEMHASLNGLAVAMMKIANDLRFYGSGPRCGLGDYQLPENEPGSSIMPGKVNPTQCEAMTMVATQVMGNNTTVSIAGSNGHFQLNVFRPVIASCVLRSIRLLADGMDSFSERCLNGLQPNHEQLEKNLRQSLMLVTALNPVIGYDKASKVAKKAHKEGTSLKEACLALNPDMTSEEFDKYVRPEEMIGPKKVRARL